MHVTISPSSFLKPHLKSSTASQRRLQYKNTNTNIPLCHCRRTRPRHWSGRNLPVSLRRQLRRQRQGPQVCPLRRRSSVLHHRQRLRRKPHLLPISRLHPMRCPTVLTKSNNIRNYVSLCNRFINKHGWLNKWLKCPFFCSSITKRGRWKVVKVSWSYCSKKVPFIS